MRIHSDTLTSLDLFEAARISRTELTYEFHGSRSRTRSVDVHLTGESKRRPNDRGRHLSHEYAATWDQWGVFLAVLFDRDPDMLCGTAKRPAYADRADFHFKTSDRFRPIGIVTSDSPGAFAVTGDPDYDGTVLGPVYRQERTYWPADAHGDHTFRFSGMPGTHKCSKCSAVSRWM
jgi:hypothetical protein